MLSSPLSTSVSTTVLGQRMVIVKSGNTVTLDNLDARQCSGAATCTSGDCRSSGTFAGAGGDGNVCFHHSTVIEYRGKRFTLKELQKGHAAAGQCHVPHVIRSRHGVIIETNCTQKAAPLQLTADHLVFTAARGGGGLVAASQLAVGDVLFADLKQRVPCAVTKMTEVKEQDTYFGLNCIHSSEVLANGIKTSTFGHYHALPAAWMRVVGHWFGIERASRWGNALANWWL